MTDYTRSTNFTAKDSLPSGNASKIVRGSEIDTELDLVASAIAGKVDEAGGTLTSGTLAGTTTLTGTLSVGSGIIDGGTY